MRAIALSLFSVVLSIAVFAQPVHISPEPASVIQPRIAAKFSISPATQIVLEGSNLEHAAAFFNDYLQRFYLFSLKVNPNAKGDNVIRLNFDRLDKDLPGAYEMTVNNKGVYIGGDNEEGVFYGIQTLIQLLPVPDAKLKMRPNTLSIPYINIQDEPRFAYRGMHLDVGRHFLPLDFVKKYIDYLALHKMNYFHWHLTDDQGWRIEIKKYPLLTQVGAWRNGTIIGRYPGKGSDNKKHGGFYTQEEIKAIVKYAADRYVTVVPEIEMPGHGSAAIAAYPFLSCFPDEPTKLSPAMASDLFKKGTGKQVQETWGVFEDVFCAGKESTFKFMQDVMDEVIPLFPSSYVHVGGDECPKESWKRCPQCQQRIAENKLKDEHELQSYFIQRMEKYLNSKGKVLIGWDEILEGGLAPKAVVMSWRGEQGGIDAAKQNHDVIMTPGNPVYFDHSQSMNEDSVTIGGYNGLDKVYAYEPIPAALNAEQGKHVMGAQANLWTEYIDNGPKAEYMIFPRMTALSEVLWSPAKKRNWDYFQQKLLTQFKRYELWNAHYSKAFFDLRSVIEPDVNAGGVTWTLSTKQKNIQLQVTDGKKMKAGSKPGVDEYHLAIRKSGTYTATQLINGKQVGVPVSVSLLFNKATGQKITLETPPSASYAGSGGFTLVDGIQNDRGMTRSREFLGFSGGDCTASIDMGKNVDAERVTVHIFHEPGSWIWRPQTIQVWGSAYGIEWTSLGLTDDVKMVNAGNGTMEVKFNKANIRFIKVKVTNWGTIPEKNPGAGTPAWLFVDEIEIN